MITVNVHEAKTRLSALLARVERGEEVTIARSGTPVARLVAHRPRSSRTPGRLKGRFRIEPRFFEPLPETVLQDFEGREL